MNSKVRPTHPRLSHQTCLGHVKVQKWKSFVPWVPLVLTLAAGVLLVGCPPPPPTPSVSHTLSGKIVDGSAGVPLAGGVVDVAGLSTTSSADGSYSLDLEQTTGTVDGTLAVHATGFTAYVLGDISVDASADSTATWVLPRVDNSALASHALNLHIYEFQTNPSTATEIPNGTPVVVSVRNENGAGGTEYGNYNGGYTWSNRISGQSCIVSAFVDLASVSSMYSFNVITKNVSMNAATQDLDLNEDVGAEKTVSVTGDAAGNDMTLYLDSPDGVFAASGATLDGSAQAILHLLNPFGYQGFWSQTDGETTADSAIGGISTNVTLPVLPSFGPLSAPDENSLAYSSGTLTLSAASGATGYFYWLTDASGNLLADVTSVGPSITLPAWLQTQLAGTTVTVQVFSTVSNMSIVDLSSIATLMINGGVAQSVNVMFAGGGTKDLAF